MEKTMPKLTILTTTYNRLSTLKRLYESLLNQTCLDFQWLVIDDGSTDDTSAFFKKINKNTPFLIEYKYKENGGKHTAINYAKPYIEGQYFTIVDSDDFLSDNAVDYIIKMWAKYNPNPNIGGITFQRGNVDGKPLDNSIVGEYVSTFSEASNNGMHSDHFETVRSILFKKFTFPVYKGEKFIAEGAMWYLVTKNYKIVYSDKVLYYCKYLDDGYTKKGKKLQLENPQGSRWHAKVLLDNENFKFSIRYKQAILFCTYNKWLKNSFFETIKKDNNKKYLLLAWLPADMIYFTWKRKY